MDATTNENGPADAVRSQRPVRFSFRLKLTLWMTIIFLAVQLALVFVLQIYQHRSINAFYDERILARQNQIALELGKQIPDVSDQFLRDYAERYRQLTFQQQFVVRVFNHEGEPVASSVFSGHTRMDSDAWSKMRLTDGGVVLKSQDLAVISPTSDPMRTAAGWVRGADGKRYVVEITWGDQFAQRMLDIVSGVLFITIPIGVVAVMVSAYAISGVAIQPIRAMRQMARGLEPEFLGQSVPFASGSSEVAALQRDLERTRLKLEAAFSAQERVMSNVSHELKTPIAVLMTEAQTLRLEGASKEIRGFVSSAMDELDKLGRMVDSFLLLTRVRHGKAAIPNRENCLARDVIMQSYEGCVSMAAQYGVQIIVNLPEGDDSEISVRGNCDLLRTVVDNLLRNAIRFSPKGQPVRLSARAEGDRLHITVRDSGTGIPSELLPRLFDRFSQSSDEQRRGRGHGLGLEIAMGITELHGGTISVRNRDEGGCEFTVALPLNRDGDVVVSS